MSRLGALMIVFACTAAGLMKSRSLTQLDRLYTELTAVLGIIKSEISSRTAPMDEIIELISVGQAGCIEPFTGLLKQGFTNLGESSFGSIWSNAVSKGLDGISPRSELALKSLGGTLGRYEAAEQAAAIERCITVISAEQSNLQSGLCANKRMYIGIGAASGLMLAIMLA